MVVADDESGAAVAVAGEDERNGSKLPQDTGDESTLLSKDEFTAIFETDTMSNDFTNEPSCETTNYTEDSRGVTLVPMDLDLQISDTNITNGATQQTQQQTQPQNTSHASHFSTLEESDLRDLTPSEFHFFAAPAFTPNQFAGPQTKPMSRLGNHRTLPEMQSHQSLTVGELNNSRDGQGKAEDATESLTRGTAPVASSSIVEEGNPGVIGPHLMEMRRKPGRLPFPESPERQFPSAQGSVIASNEAYQSHPQDNMTAKLRSPSSREKTHTVDPNVANSINIPPIGSVATAMRSAESNSRQVLKAPPGHSDIPNSGAQARKNELSGCNEQGANDHGHPVQCPSSHLPVASVAKGHSSPVNAHRQEHEQCSPDPGDLASLRHEHRTRSKTPKSMTPFEALMISLGSPPIARSGSSASDVAQKDEQSRSQAPTREEAQDFLGRFFAQDNILKEKLQAREKERDLFVVSLERLRQQYYDDKEKWAIRDQKHKDLAKSQVDNLERVNEQLTRESEDLQRHVSQKAKDVEELTTLLQSAQSRVQDLRGKCKEFKRRFNMSVDEYQAMHNQSKSAWQKAMQQCEESHEQYRELRLECDNLRHRLQEKIREVQEAEAQKSTIAAQKMKTHEKHIQRIEAELEEHKDFSLAIVKWIEAENKDTLSEKLKVMIERLEEETNTEPEGLVARRAKATAARLQSISTIDPKANARLAAENAHTELLGRLDNVKQSVARLQENQAVVQDSLQHIEQETTNNTRSLLETHSSRETALRQDLARMENSEIAVKAHLETLQSQLQEARDVCRDKDKCIEDLRQTLQNARDNSEAELTKLRAESGSLQSRLDEQVSAMADLRASSEELGRKHQEALDSLSEKLQSTIHQLYEKMQESESTEAAAASASEAGREAVKKLQDQAQLVEQQLAEAKEAHGITKEQLRVSQENEHRQRFLAEQEKEQLQRKIEDAEGRLQKHMQDTALAKPAAVPPSLNRAQQQAVDQLIRKGSDLHKLEDRLDRIAYEAVEMMKAKDYLERIMYIQTAAQSSIHTHAASVAQLKKVAVQHDDATIINEEASPVGLTGRLRSSKALANEEVVEIARPSSKAIATSKSKSKSDERNKAPGKSILRQSRQTIGTRDHTDVNGGVPATLEVVSSNNDVGLSGEVRSSQRLALQQRSSIGGAEVQSTADSRLDGRIGDILPDPSDLQGIRDSLGHTGRKRKRSVNVQELVEEHQKKSRAERAA